MHVDSRELEEPHAHQLVVVEIIVLMFVQVVMVQAEMDVLAAVEADVQRLAQVVAEGLVVEHVKPTVIQDVKIVV